MQGRAPFIALTRERGNQPELPAYFPEEVTISIPKSEAYSKRSMLLAKLTFREQPVSSVSADGLTTEWSTTEVVEGVLPHGAKRKQ